MYKKYRRPKTCIWEATEMCNFTKILSITRVAVTKKKKKSRNQSILEQKLSRLSDFSIISANVYALHNLLLIDEL